MKFILGEFDTFPESLENKASRYSVIAYLLGVLNRVNGLCLCCVKGMYIIWNGSTPIRLVKVNELEFQISTQPI